ncbi:MAG: gamma-glutamyl-gamma-aminobutyrate hydrolase family protein [Frankiales bacterium]|nr:gamma-glutamyl-gamma-aminobutyrate hydrolase family protein [Frankiales bacterium]
MSHRPIVAVPGRFSASASAHRHRALTTARALSEGVLLAGGEPVTVHPWAPGGSVTPEEVGERLAFADAVLLPGGGDLSPATYGQPVASDDVYDVDDEQDAFDLAVARWAISSGTPLLAVCRGWQVVNVALGGTLEQHMAEPHRHVVHTVAVVPGTLLGDVVGPTVQASCYHHQRADVLGAGLVPVARAADGTVEGAVLPSAAGWFLAVQWHPEDTVTDDPAQLALFRALVDAGR